MDILFTAVLNTYSKPVLVGPPKSKSGEMAKQSNTEKAANAQRRQKPAAKPPMEGIRNYQMIHVKLLIAHCSCNLSIFVYK